MTPTDLLRAGVRSYGSLKKAGPGGSDTCNPPSSAARPPSAVAKEDFLRILDAPLPWHRLAGKTVLITGANGFLAAYMIETLLAVNDHFNHQVRIVGLVRDRARAEQRFGHQLGRPDLELLIQDVATPLNPSGDINVIIHAASQASPKYYSTDPVGTLLANTAGTMNLLQTAAGLSVEQFMFFSSSEVYGQNPGPQRVDERSFGYLDPMDWRSCYAESKRMGETMCISWMRQFGVPVRIVRPFHTYGPGMDLDDGRVFADFVRDAVEGRDIMMKSDGLAVRAFCYLADAVRAFFTVLLTGADGEAYNVGNDEAEVSILQLAELIAEIAPRPGLRVLRAPQDIGYLSTLVTHAAPDVSKVRALGWAPRTSIEEGFRRTIESYL